MKTTAKEPRRRGLSLGARIFLISALLIALAVGAAVAVTYLRGSQVAERAIQRSLSGSISVQNDFLAKDLQRLELIGQMLSKDPTFVSYIAESVGGGLEGEQTLNSESIQVELNRRRQSLEFDFGMVVDVDGYVLAHTSRPEAVGEDLADRPLVQQLINEFTSGTDYWRDRDDLFQVAAVPLIQRLDFYGALILGDRMNDNLANQIKRITGSDMTFLMGGSDGLVLPATTLPAAESANLVEALEAEPQLLQQVLEQGQSVLERDFFLSDHRRGSIAPLKGLGGETVAAAVSLVSLDEQMAGYRQIQREVLLAGIAALIVALLFSFTLSSRTLRPVRRLAVAAEAAAQGDYGTRIEVKRRDEVGRLALAFRSLLSDLREKKEVESFVGDLSRRMPEPAAGAGRSIPTEVRDSAYLAMELRGLAHPSLVQKPEEGMEKLTRQVRTASSVIASNRGRVEGIVGHRLLASFPGLDGGLRAVSAGSELRRMLSVPESAFDDVTPPAIAITMGKATKGSVIFEEAPTPVLVGLPLQQLESLLREAAPGDLVLSREVERRLGDTLRGAGVELAENRGMLSTQPLFLVTSDEADQRLMPAAQTSLLEPAVPSATPGATLSGLGPGAVLGDRFEILAVLGSGGMGVVYKALDRELDDLVALKTLKRDAWGDPGLLERLKSELKLARRITHPNVLRTFDFGEVGGIPFISMEFVRGLTVRYLLEQTGRLPPSAGLRLGRQLCSGLAAAHAVGVLHRDIKPENLILDNAGNLKLMDFGIARPVDGSGPGQTMPGSVIGTPHYLAPEQLEGKPVDGRVDIYASGVVLFEMFTGGLPFEGDNPMQIVTAHLREEPRRPSELWPEIPETLEAVILRCLARDPAERFASAQDLLQALENLRAPTLHQEVAAAS